MSETEQPKGIAIACIMTGDEVTIGKDGFAYSIARGRRREITDEMVRRALSSFTTSLWEPDEENDILLSHDRMREALEAALNG